MSSKGLRLDFFKTFVAKDDRRTDWQAQRASLPSAAKREWEKDAEGYVAHPRVAEAVNVAITLGKPLLVTGDPGVGKTALAGAIAWQLQLGRPLKFVAKSTTEASDLFYSYDALRRFHAIEMARLDNSGGKDEASTKGKANKKKPLDPANPLDFIEYEALGRAVLSAHPYEKVKNFLKDDSKGDGGTYVHPSDPEPSVVLIDEIDKASSDFCNDLLDEFDNLQFKVQELGGQETPDLDRRNRPIIIITSNRERDLPPAFLRRCVYAHIPQPGSRLRDQVDDEAPDYVIEEILDLRLRDYANYEKDSIFVHSVLELVELTTRGRPSRAPSTAEIIEFLAFCAFYRTSDDKAVDWQKPIADQDFFFTHAMTTLAKTEGDAKLTQSSAPNATVDQKKA